MRLAADQLVFAPAFIAVFFSSLLILEVGFSTDGLKGCSKASQFA